jgi:glycosyltransferase involved in cell wall biosynthesis
MISIVVPIYNEAEMLLDFYHALKAVLIKLPYDFELIFVNDGSQDSTLAILKSLKAKDSSIAILNLSRNFGKEIALTAGLDHAKGQAAIMMDADLQDPPDLIPKLIDAWLAGHEVVYAKRLGRGGESIFKRLSAYVFYRILALLSNVPMQKDTGDYRLLGSKALKAMRSIREQHRYMKGLFCWIGFAEFAIPYQRPSRLKGHSKWAYLKLFDLAIEGITSFSIKPLRLATLLGVLFTIISIVYASFFMIKWAFSEELNGSAIHYPLILTSIFFIGGIQLLSLGIIGEYLGRLFHETKQRPLYLIADFDPSGLDFSKLFTLREDDLIPDSLETKKSNTLITPCTPPVI